MTNLEKLKQNLESIEIGLFDKFMKEYDREIIQSNIDADSPNLIGEAFFWVGTKQGHTYWERIHELYFKLIQKGNK